MKKYRFTLIELLVALGVFSILLVFMLQFFSSAQKVWTGSEKKSRVYSDVRVAMDVMTTMLQNTLFSTDGTENVNGTPFLIVPGNNTTQKAKLFFCAKSPYRLAGSSNVVYVGFLGPTIGNSSDYPGELRMAVLCDEQDAVYEACFPPYSTTYPYNSTSEPDGAVQKVMKTIENNGKAASSTSLAKYQTVLLKNVLDFSIRAFKLDKAAGTFTVLSDSDLNNRTTMPYLIELNISVMDPDNYNIYKDLTDADKKKEFESQHKYTFSRVVFLNGQL